MKKAGLFFSYCITTFMLSGQSSADVGYLTASDIRHASGDGPFPVYVNLQMTYAHNKSLFAGFTDMYKSAHAMKRGVNKLYGFESNIGVVINERHFLGIKNWLVRGLSLEAGYRYLYANMTDHEAKRLHLQESVMSLRIGKRLNVIYPLTFQLQTGPTLYNFVTVNESTEGGSLQIRRERIGYGLTEGSKRLRRIIGGWDLRGRIVLFDPAGTTGGLGLFVEYRYLFTFGGRDLSPLYKTFLGPHPKVKKNWDYGAFSAGLVAPLALRMRGFHH